MKATAFERTEAAAQLLRQRLTPDAHEAQRIRLAVEIARAKDVDLDDLLDCQEQYHP